jgi:hypothetical protein
MRLTSAFLSLLLILAFAGCGPAEHAASPQPVPSGEAPALDLAVHKDAGALGTFRAAFTFPDGWRPPRDVLIVLAPFSAQRDREGAYDPARLFDAAEALIGGLGDGDRVNVVSYQDLLHGESWFPKEYPFVENADDLFVRPVVAFDEWKLPAEAVAGLAALRERGVETVRNTSWFIELLKEAARTLEPSDGRVAEIIVVADSHSAPTKGFLDGLPVKVPKIRLEPLDPEWTAAFFWHLRSKQIHVDFVVVAPDEELAFSPKRLRRMAESTRGFYFEWPDDEAHRERCVQHIATNLHRGLEVDLGKSDANYTYTNRWSPNGNKGLVVWGRYTEPGTYTFMLRDTLRGGEWPFRATLPDEAAEHAELPAEWARQRVLDGVWKLATYGPDDYLAYDLWQLARRYGLALPESFGASPLEQPPQPVEYRPPRRGEREPLIPAVEEGAELPAHSALAELAPYDMLYVRYSRLRSSLELLDAGYFYGRDVIQALGLHPDITMIEDKAQTQICVQVSRKLTKLYEAAVAEVAEVSTGATVSEGTDVCLIMRIKMPAVFRLRINQFRQQAVNDYPGTRKRYFRHEGVVVTETLGQHNVVRSYFAMFKHTPRGAGEPQTFAVSGNSWAAVRRVLDVHAGKVPSVIANDDFCEFREKLQLAGFTNEETGEHLGENVFVYFGAPAAQALTDWRVAALKQEQQVVAAHLRLLRNALASYARDRGVLLDEPHWPDTIMTDLVENGYLPAVPAHPGIGAYAFDPDLQVFYSTRYGRLGWLTPMADLMDQLGEPVYGKPEIGPTAAQLAWTDDVVLTRAITRPDPDDFKFALLRALAGKATSDFSTFRELMQRPGLAVAMKSRLLQFGTGGLGMSKTQIALNLLANKVKGEIKKAIGWEDKADPFAWAGDEICVVLDAGLAAWRTAVVDPPVALGIKVDDEAGAAGVLDVIAKAPGAVKRDLALVPNIVTVGGWSFVMQQGDRPIVVAARDAWLLAVGPSGEESPLRRFLPSKCHALIRFDSTHGDELLRTALGLYGPAAEEQAQRAMARFESLYGNRLAPFRLRTVPMLDEAPRPAGSQYGIDPIEERIASDVYGLPGDFLLTGRVPEDAGIRKVLAQQAVGYGAVVLHKDSIEFVGAAPNPGIGVWKKERLPSSMTVSHRIRELRATDSLRKLAAAAREHDGYLWRLGLRGFEIDAKRFEELLDGSATGTPPRFPVEEAIGQGSELDERRAREVFIGSIPDIVHHEIPQGPVEVVPVGLGPPFTMPFGGHRIGRWLRWRLLTNSGLPTYDKHGVQAALCMLGWLAFHSEDYKEDEQTQAYVRTEERLIGWSLIARDTATGGHLRTFLRDTKDLEAFRSTATAIKELLWPSEVVEYARKRAEEYLRIIEKQ